MLDTDNRLLEKLLSSFRCINDYDIQNFLKSKAIEFERISKSRTYLIVDKEQLQNSDITLDKIIIYGYISLAVKVLAVPENASNRLRKQLDGFSAKQHGKPISHFPCYLIGQLARNSDVPKSSISGTDLLNFAYDIIGTAVEAVGGRYVLIECNNNEKLLKFYSDNDFSEINRENHEDRIMVQMIHKV